VTSARRLRLKARSQHGEGPMHAVGVMAWPLVPERLPESEIENVDPRRVTDSALAITAERVNFRSADRTPIRSPLTGATEGHA
jgi:hypothetical protein